MHEERVWGSPASSVGGMVRSKWAVLKMASDLRRRLAASSSILRILIQARGISRPASLFKRMAGQTRRL